MSVSQYEIPCAYDLLKLKDTVFFLSKNSLKTITIDNGEAYVDFVNQSPQPPSPNRLKGFNVKLTETESLDERYVFTKQLTMSITGHLTDSTFLLDDDYYIVVQTEDGTYYLVNVDFPSKMSFVYNLSEGQDQTDFTFVSNSNHPTLKLNWNPVTWNTCQTYQVYGIDSLKLLEKDYTTIDGEQGVINLFDGHEFKDVDYLKNTISLQENYDGKIATTTITFEIPFNNYKPSWQYNLLEFDQNLYAAHITPKNSTSGIFCGYEHGLQPSYEINGNASNGESTSIKITLTEASEWGIFELDTWSYYRDSSNGWIGVDSEHICVEFGIGAYLLMQEVDGNGTPTGRYKCLEGYENRYSNYNIVGTYEEAPRFTSSDCARSMARRVNTDEIFTCINGDKYSIKFTQMSYDNKKTWVRVSDYELGEMVESGSSFCEIEPQYKWKISDEWECIDQFVRWIPSGTTCILGNKYQNNYKQVSDDHVHWRDSDPLEWSASTVVEYDSEDCRIYKWSPTNDTICVDNNIRYKTTSGTPFCSGDTGCDKYTLLSEEVSYDGGETWETIVSYYDLERCSDYCNCTGFTPTEDYLRFVPLENGSFTFHKGDLLRYNLECSYDGGLTWKHIIDNGAPASVTVTCCKNQTILWRGYGEQNGRNGNFIGSFSSSNKYDVEGNVLSMYYYDDFQDKTSIPSFLRFQNLFKDDTNVVNASGMSLPATEITSSAYTSMFEGCTSLRTAPQVLPAYYSAHYSYMNMFKGCTSLTTVPIIESINRCCDANYCCKSMFEGCTSLTTLPSNMLPSTSLSYGGYSNMFANCTSLTTAPELPATSMADMCYYGMFSGCTSLVTAPELPATSLLDICSRDGGTYASMFANCTSLTTAPELPATKLENGCYSNMFANCTSLTTAPELPATTLEFGCYANMFKGCVSLTTAPELPATTMEEGCYGNMFSGCTSLRTVPQVLPATTMAEQCYYCMFRDCTSLTTAPELPNATLARWCYQWMFKDCRNLKYVKCLQTLDGEQALGWNTEWLIGTSPTGTFVKLSSVDWGLCGESRIPCGWEIINV